jgi:hypothetical protein
MNKAIREEIKTIIRDVWLGIAPDIFAARLEMARFEESGFNPSVMPQDEVVEVTLDAGRVEMMLQQECSAEVAREWKALGWKGREKLGYEALPEKEWS